MSTRLQIESANLVMRTLVVINGGAAIAILTFLGGISARDKIDFTKVGPVTESLKWFAAGVAVTVFAMGLAYVTQYTMVGTANAMEMISETPFLKRGPRYGRWLAF